MGNRTWLVFDNSTALVQRYSEHLLVLIFPAIVFKARSTESMWKRSTALLEKVNSNSDGKVRTTTNTKKHDLKRLTTLGLNLILPSKRRRWRLRFEEYRVLMIQPVCCGMYKNCLRANNMRRSVQRGSLEQDCSKDTLCPMCNTSSKQQAGMFNTDYMCNHAKDDRVTRTQGVNCRAYPK